MIEAMPKVKNVNTVIKAQKILHNSFSQMMQEKMLNQDMKKNERQMLNNVPYWLRGK